MKFYTVYCGKDKMHYLNMVTGEENTPENTKTLYSSEDARDVALFAAQLRVWYAYLKEQNKVREA